MESRIAVISIIVENSDSVECLNRILHEYGIYIIGRMGIPYRQRGISIISVAIDAPLDIINAPVSYTHLFMILHSVLTLLLWKRVPSSLTELRRVRNFRFLLPAVLHG